jgi:hypothetical protein
MVWQASNESCAYFTFIVHNFHATILMIYLIYISSWVFEKNDVWQFTYCEISIFNKQICMEFQRNLYFIFGWLDDKSLC